MGQRTERERRRKRRRRRIRRLLISVREERRRAAGATGRSEKRTGGWRITTENREETYNLLLSHSPIPPHSQHLWCSYSNHPTTHIIITTTTTTTTPYLQCPLSTLHLHLIPALQILFLQFSHIDSMTQTPLPLILQLLYPPHIIRMLLLCLVLLVFIVLF